MKAHIDRMLIGSAVMLGIWLVGFLAIHVKIISDILLLLTIGLTLGCLAYLTGFIISEIRSAFNGK